MASMHADMHHGIVQQPDEQGTALVGLLLLLLMMSVLAVAVVLNGRTETLISGNQRSSTQATAAAEAGLNHAVELATTYIFEWKTNGFTSVDAAIDALLVGPGLGTRTGITVAEAIPLGTRLTITGGIDAEYEALIMDDDADAPDEPDGDLFDDENATLVVRATGYAAGNTKAVLEALIGPLALPAVLVNGDLTASGSVSIQGSEGSVHANGDLVIQRRSVWGNGDVNGIGFVYREPRRQWWSSPIPRA